MHQNLAVSCVMAKTVLQYWSQTTAQLFNLTSIFIEWSDLCVQRSTSNFTTTEPRGRTRFVASFRKANTFGVFRGQPRPASSLADKLFCRFGPVHSAERHHPFAGERSLFTILEML